jgi:hypothetical protein
METIARRGSNCSQLYSTPLSLPDFALGGATAPRRREVDWLPRCHVQPSERTNSTQPDRSSRAESQPHNRGDALLADLDRVGDELGSQTGKPTARFILSDPSLHNPWLFSGVECHIM